MKILIASTSNVAIPTIETLFSEGHQVTLVTLTDRTSGRGNRLIPTEIASRYQNVHKVEDESDLQELLRNQDLLITIAFGWILKEETLSIPKFGGINLHFSLLPKWRGAAPVQRALENGDKVTGVTVFQMDSGMDTGPIWSQLSFEIPENCDATSLFQALSEMGSDAIVQSLTKIEYGELPIKQVGEASIASKITKIEGKLDWTQSSEMLLRKIKAFNPNPGTYTQFRGQILKIIEAKPSEYILRPGEINQFGATGTSTQAIQILFLKPAGKNEMTIKDWLNGYKPNTGELFE